MAVLKKYNLSGSEVGEIALDDAMLESSANSQMIKDYIVALRENARQWSANTKSRDEVNHSGKKPHPQKGTGRARQGYLGSPQYKGGGRVHAPKPKFDMHVRINRKEKRAAIRHLLVEKILGNKVHILELDNLSEPKTKRVADFLKKSVIQGKRVLFLGESFNIGAKEGQTTESPTQKFQVFVKSMRNIPGSAFMLVPNVSGYDVLVNHELVVMDSAIDQLKMILAGGQ